MKIKNLKEWWQKREKWERIISIFVVLNIVFSIIFTLISDWDNTPNLIFSFAILLVVLIGLGLLFLVNTKNPKSYWVVGIIISIVYFTMLTLAFYDAIKPQGESNAFIVPLVLPFGLVVDYFLPRGVPSLFGDWISFVSNFIGLILAGVLIGFIFDKLKKGK